MEAAQSHAMATLASGADRTSMGGWTDCALCGLTRAPLVALILHGERQQTPVGTTQVVALDASSVPSSLLRMPPPLHHLSVS